MKTALDGPNLKVERARIHLQELKSVNYAFLHSDPPPFDVDRERTETGALLYRAIVTQEPPPMLGVILGDIFHNLRSALDQLAWQCVIAGGGTPGRATYFPIVESKGNLEGSLRTMVQGARVDCLELIRNVKPYKGGNDHLWRLHELNRFDKHRLLPVATIAMKSMQQDVFDLVTSVWEASNKELSPESLAYLMVHFPALNFKAPTHIFPVVDGKLIEALAPGAPDVLFVVYVALGQGAAGEGERIPGIAEELIDEVERVIETFRGVL